MSDRHHGDYYAAGQIVAPPTSIASCIGINTTVRATPGADDGPANCRNEYVHVRMGVPLRSCARGCVCVCVRMCGISHPFIVPSFRLTHLSYLWFAPCCLRQDALR